MENIDVSLYFRNANQGFIDDPEIGIAGIAEGKLDYVTLDHSKTPSTKTKTVETYEEALKALQEP